MTRLTEKHLPYFVVLEALRESRECPLCALESTGMTRYFETLLYEHVNDPGVREDLVRSNGYCSRHAHRLLESGDSFGISILYQDLVNRFAHFVQEVVEHPVSRRLKAMNNWTAHEDCPACRFQKEARKGHIRVLLAWLREPDMRQSFHECAGLCVPHLLFVMDEVRDTETREFFLGVMHTKYAKLLADLSEFQRKRNWRHAHEPFGNERDSWARAVRMMVGERGLF